jgi:alpha/beta superfamily hydrolase
MKEEQITFYSGELTLEGMIARPDTSTVERGAVVCHPHPLYGGSMYNNVVEAALEAMWRLGWATLRFNFRGVGQSEGEHSSGSGEADDAVAAVHFMAHELAISSQKIVLAGYSFGAMAALNAASKLTDLGALMLIALPLRMAEADALNQINAPIVLAAGDHDNYCPPAQLQAMNQALGSRAQLKIISGADHFFGGYEAELADALEGMLKSI